MSFYKDLPPIDVANEKVASASCYKGIYKGEQLDAVIIETEEGNSYMALKAEGDHTPITKSYVMKDYFVKFYDVPLPNHRSVTIKDFCDHLKNQKLF